MLQALPGMLLGGVAHGADLSERRGLARNLQRLTGGGDLAGHALAAGELDREDLVGADAANGGPRHGDLAEKFTFEGELGVILLNDGAGDGVAVLQDNLVSVERGKEGEEAKRQSQETLVHEELLRAV